MECFCPIVVVLQWPHAPLQEIDPITFRSICQNIGRSKHNVVIGNLWTQGWQSPDVLQFSLTPWVA